VRRHDGRILVRIDATDDPGRIVSAFGRSALLEIIDPQGQYIPPGAIVMTTLNAPLVAGDAAATPLATEGRTPVEPVYETIISGTDLRDAYITVGNTEGVNVVGFALTPAAAQRMYDYTSTHVGQPMTIVLDKQVMSSPRITGAIAEYGIIEDIPPDQVATLAVQLKGSTLPVPLVLVQSHTVPAAAPTSTPAAA
jgi:preprotein translocase subunit SecD